MENHFITKIYIEKVRHLKDINIDISERKKKHLIFTGKNGSGKTSVLNSIKSYLKSIEEENYYDLLNTYKSIDLSLEALNDINSDSNMTDSQKLAYSKDINQDIIASKELKNKYEGELKLSFNSNKELLEKYKAGEFILDYFDSHRMTRVQLPTGVEKIILNENYKIEEKLNSMFVKYLVDLKTQQAFAQNEGDVRVVENIKIWFERFENSLRLLLDDEGLKLKFDYKNYNFEIIQTDREPYGFNELSDGYSAILNIIMDLILRMEKKKREIYDVEGIVLIDEIETHLHIELQKKIMPFLTDFFPNIQFIITTHSPFVLSSLDNAVIYDLEKRIKVEDLSSYSYEGIVEGYFDVDKYSDEIKEKLLRYEQLVNDVDITDKEKDEMLDLRQYLKDISIKLAPELVYKFRDIELKRRGGKHD